MGPSEFENGRNDDDEPAEAKTVQRSETARWDEIEADDENTYLPDYCYASRYTNRLVPRNHLPKGSFPAAEAYQVIKDLRQLDHNPRMNLASFVTTWMEPEAEKVMMEAANVNFVDADQYRSCNEMERRCVNMLSALFNAPEGEQRSGSGTIGSSEAIMLAGLSLKKRWQSRRQEEGKYDPAVKPNLVMGSHVQVCWHKFCRYFDVEERLVPLSDGRFVINGEDCRSHVDENTIGICGILGSTYNGEYDDIESMDKLSEELREENGWVVPIHVDAASGGFIAPFLTPDLKWDFRLKNVDSINVSGHKYGLVYAGIGWVLFRNRSVLHDDLVFETNYLGSKQESITLNFSRSAANVVAQYYQFLRLGFKGYKAVMTNLQKITARLRAGIEDMGVFDVVSNDHSVPLVAFCLNKKLHEAADKDSAVPDEFDFADKMKERGWIMPAYTMAPNVEDMKIIRIVVREDMSATLMEELLRDLRWALDDLKMHYNALTSDAVDRIRNKTRTLDKMLTLKNKGAACT